MLVLLPLTSSKLSMSRGPTYASSGRHRSLGRDFGRPAGGPRTDGGRRQNTLKYRFLSFFPFLSFFILNTNVGTITFDDN